ncbi:MAG: 50S ribosomal protein L37 [Candidatus Nitrosothermus koennekii]|nr:MAG: 50S ribosomal protein L37 [Candidatus Nitrosothermus koennekii]
MVKRKKTKERLKGLGAKYGATLRRRYASIYKLLKKKRTCPKCGSIRFKREAIGIWKCYKCNYTIAGGAYDIASKHT